MVPWRASDVAPIPSRGALSTAQIRKAQGGDAGTTLTLGASFARNNVARIHCVQEVPEAGETLKGRTPAKPRDGGHQLL